MKIRIEGLRIDRLADEALKAGLDVRGLRMKGALTAECTLTAADLKALRRMAGARYRITALERKGAGFAAKRFVKSPLSLAGLALIAFIVIAQSFFVRTVEISGYKSIPESELRRCLAESGVKEGAYLPKVDWEEAQRRVYDVFPQVTWARLVYDGRKVFLEIAEGGRNTEEEDQWLSSRLPGGSGNAQEGGQAERPYCDVIAERAGYVESISVFRGLALVGEGDYVSEGQTLITGRVPLSPTTYDEDKAEEYYVRAAGEITIVTPFRLTFNQERYLSATAGAQEAAGKQDDTQADGGDGLVASKNEKTRAQAEARANQQIRQWAKENLPENAQILNKDLNFSYKENIIEVGVTLEVRLQVGIEQELFIGQENSDRSGD